MKNIPFGAEFFEEVSTLATSGADAACQCTYTTSMYDSGGNYIGSDGTGSDGSVPCPVQQYS